MKCILLCAGYATRLYPLTKNFPKSLLEVKPDKSILDFIMDEVNTIDEIDEVYVITNHVFYNYFCEWVNGKRNGKKIIIIDDYTTSNDDRLGAIGDIQYTIDSQNISDDLMIIAGDNLFDYSLKDVVSYFYSKGAPVVCGKELFDKQLLKRLAVASIDNSDKIVNLVEKPDNPEGNVAVYATYLYPKDILMEIKQYLTDGNKPDAPGYFVEYLYKKMPVYVYCFEGNCYDVGTLDALQEVKTLYLKK